MSLHLPTAWMHVHYTAFQKGQDQFPAYACTGIGFDFCPVQSKQVIHGLFTGLKSSVTLKSSNKTAKYSGR